MKSLSTMLEKLIRKDKLFYGIINPPWKEKIPLFEQNKTLGLVRIKLWFSYNINIIEFS